MLRRAVGRALAWQHSAAQAGPLSLWAGLDVAQASSSSCKDDRAQEAGSQAPGCCMHTSALQQQQGSGEREQGASSTSSAPCTGGQAGAPHSTLQAMHMLPPTSGRAPLGLGSALHGPSQLPCPLLGGASSGSSASPSSASSSQSSSASRELGSAQRGFFSLPNPQEFKEEFLSPDRAATSAFITANLATYAATALNRRLLMALVQSNYLLAKGEWYRLVTASFCHGGLLHLLGNMLAVHWLGPPVEQVAGRTVLAAVYLSGAVGGGLMHYHFGNWGTTVLGSSGAIAGLFAAFVVFKLRNRHHVGFTSQDMSWIGQIVALNVVLSLLMSGSIAHWAHFGGLVGGAAAMWLAGPRYVWEGGRVVDRPLLPFFKNLP